MSDNIDWTETTFEGSRRRQREAFCALSFREKVARVEEMSEVVAMFATRRRSPGSGPTNPDSANSDAATSGDAPPATETNTATQWEDGLGRECG